MAHNWLRGVAEHTGEGSVILPTSSFHEVMKTVNSACCDVLEADSAELLRVVAALLRGQLCITGLNEC